MDATILDETARSTGPQRLGKRPPWQALSQAVSTIRGGSQRIAKRAEVTPVGTFAVADWIMEVSNSTLRTAARP
jgi:hypothetical protein